MPGLLAQAGELAEAGDEDAGHARWASRASTVLYSAGEVAARPELFLEAVRREPLGSQQLPLAEDDRPGDDRRADQQRHDELHDEARLQDQVEG